MLLKVTLFQAQPVTLSLRRLLPRRLLAWIIHENAQFSLDPRVHRDNRTFHE